MNPDPYAALLRRPEWFQQLTKGNTESQWQPIPSRAWTLAYYIVLLLCGLPIGGVLYAFTLKNITLALRYSFLFILYSYRDFLSFRYDNFNEGLTDVERMSQLFEPGEIQYSLVFIAEETMNAPVRRLKPSFSSKTHIRIRFGDLDWESHVIDTFPETPNRMHLLRSFSIDSSRSVRRFCAKIVQYRVVLIILRLCSLNEIQA